MALKFIDGFDHYGPSNTPSDVLNTGVGSYARYIGSNSTKLGLSPRISGSGGYSIAVSYQATNGQLDLTFGNQSTTIIGFGYCATYEGNPYGYSINGGPFWIVLGDDSVTVNDNGVFGNVPAGQVSIAIGTDGSITAYQGSPANAATNTNPTTTYTQIGKATNLLNVNVWNFIEIKTVTGTGTSGSLVVRVNSKTVLSLTGIATQCTSNAWVSNCQWYYQDKMNAYDPCIDDLYLCDGTTGSNPTYPNNNFLGELQVWTGVPNGNTSVQWTPLSGTNYQNVDALQNDRGSTYNSTTTAGNVDLLTIQSLPTYADAVIAIQITGSYERTGTAPHTVGQRISSSGTLATGGTYSTVLGGYQFFSDVFEIDPQTAGTWTIASAGSLEIGYSLVS